MPDLPQLQQVPILCLALTLAYTFIPSNSDDHVYAHVGGNVTFTLRPTPLEPQTFLYLQQCSSDRNGNEPKFLQGFYEGRDLGKHLLQEFRNRTSVNRTLLTITLWEIRVSDDGCYVLAHNKDEQRTYLHVSANYETPTLTVRPWRSAGSDQGGGAAGHCGHGAGNLGDRAARAPACLVTCASHAGHPAGKVEWGGNVTRNATLFQRMNDSQEMDPHTSLFNTSNTALVSCSSGRQLLACSVGGSASADVTVCEPETKDPAQGIWGIIWWIVVLGLLAFVGVAVVGFRRRACSRRSRVDSEGGNGAEKEETKAMQIRILEAS